MLFNLDDSLSPIEGSSSDLRSGINSIKMKQLPRARKSSLESKLREFKSNGDGSHQSFSNSSHLPRQSTARPSIPQAWNAKSRQPAYTQTFHQVDVEYAEPEPKVVTRVRLTENATYTIKGVTKDGNGDLIFLINKESQDRLGNPQWYQDDGRRYHTFLRSSTQGLQQRNVRLLSMCSWRQGESDISCSFLSTLKINAKANATVKVCNWVK